MGEGKRRDGGEGEEVVESRKWKITTVRKQTEKEDDVREEDRVGEVEEEKKTGRKKAKREREEV